jgi:crotonobetainyl-CoA:carnitine CoA-transferase CaiB-like acyl-CoA transferase
MERFETTGIPAGPVQTYADMFADPQVTAREMVARSSMPPPEKPARSAFP